MKSEKSLPILRFSHNPNANLDGTVFPVIRPWDPSRFQPEALFEVLMKGEFFCQAKVLRGVKIPTLQKFPEMALMLATGIPDPESILKTYTLHYKDRLDLSKTPFGFYLMQRL